MAAKTCAGPRSNAGAGRKGSHARSVAAVIIASCCKRGRGSPGKKPIVVAVETDDKKRPRRLKIRRIPRFKRARVKALAERIIAPASTVITDGLRCFRGVADAGCTHIAVVTGSGPAAARHPSFKWVNTLLGNIKTAITGTYRSIRKKHIVRYLAEFEWRFQQPLRSRRHDPGSRPRRGSYKTKALLAPETG